jgi:hypothetical protein
MMGKYCIQETVLAQGEQSLYRALTLVVAQRALLLSKVKLSALIMPAAEFGPGFAQTYLDRYTVDFVLCDRRTTRPLLIVLQDEQTHTPGAVNDTIAHLATDAGLPVVRIAYEGAYRMEQLLRLIEPYLQGDVCSGDAKSDERRTVSKVPSVPAVPRPATLFSRN